jgi:hypothetical protein
LIVMRASALLDHSFGKTSRCPPSGTNGWRPGQIAFLFQASGSESIEAPSLHFGERSQTGIIEWRLRTACDILHKLVEESACIARARTRLVHSGSWTSSTEWLASSPGCGHRSVRQVAKVFCATTNVTAGVTIGPLPHGDCPHPQLPDQKLE